MPNKKISGLTNNEKEIIDALGVPDIEQAVGAILDLKQPAKYTILSLTIDELGRVGLATNLQFHEEDVLEQIVRLQDGLDAVRKNYEQVRFDIALAREKQALATQAASEQAASKQAEEDVIEGEVVEADPS